jgi:hypothetical protein
MKSYGDMYFVSALFAYGAALDKVTKCENRKEFTFSTEKLEKVYLLTDGEIKLVNDMTLEDAYKNYQIRKLMYPPNFPEGRRRFLELLHADQF